MRRPHYLPGVSSTETPGNFIIVDTETRPKIDANGVQHHYLWFGWAVYRRKLTSGNWGAEDWFRFTTRREFWDWVYSKSRPKTRLFLFAHNGGFDLPVLGAFSILPEDGWENTSAVVDAPPMILKWRRKNHTLQFIDTLNIWRTPLAEIGDSVGEPKLDMPSPRASQKKWDRYCQRDVKVLMVALMKWWAFLIENDLGPFSNTLASQAFNTYRYRFMPTRIFIDGDERSLALSRASYLGGRTECWRLGTYKGPFYYLDVNSLYPSVMQNSLYPYQLVGTYTHPSLAELKRWVKKYSCYGEVQLVTTDPIYPLVRDDKLQFPVGSFTTTLAHPELVEALARGHVKRCMRVAVYHHDYLFKDFVDWFYAARLAYRADGDKLHDWLTKILMNSLYGKFGQRGRRYETIGECEPDSVRVWTELDGETSEVFQMREFGGITQQWIEEDESRNSFPAIAASVCAYGRLVLWRAIEAVGRDSVYYMDTDSLVVDERGYKRLSGLLSAATLGAWKLEGILDSITLHGPKDYVFDGLMKIKGIRRNAEQIGPAKWEQDQFTGFAGLLRAGSLDAPMVRRITKSLKRRYSKGKVSPTGRVLPFTLRE